MSKWLTVEAERSFSQFDVLPADTEGISAQLSACDQLLCMAKVVVFVCEHV